MLITDQRMPEMSGDQLLRVVKERWPTTIRMVITAYSGLEPILSAVSEGLVARSMIKPWERDEVVQVLRWAIEVGAFGKESATLQRRLLETERLATLGSLAGAVVHDINQPLRGLILNTERLVDVLARIGTPFFTTRREGIGLGVAQCPRLVGKSGGTFRIVSDAGVGTTVTFTLPLAT